MRTNAAITGWMTWRMSKSLSVCLLIEKNLGGIDSAFRISSALASIKVRYLPYHKTACQHHASHR